METTFKIGQTVKAVSTAQGMAPGWEYKVKDIIKDVTPWGTFVEYILVIPNDEDQVFRISNGHLLLVAA